MFNWPEGSVKLNEVKSTLSPSESLNDIVLIIEPLLAPLVFKLAAVFVNVIVGATLSVTLTTKVVWDGVPNPLLAVTLPFIWVPPSYTEPDMLLPKET